MLELRDVHASYGPVLALRGISVAVAEGEIATVLGANGAGKSSTLRAISGLLRPTQGSILFDGRPIDTMPPERIVQLGVSHVPEGRQIFSEMSVKENLMLGAWTRRDGNGVRADLEQVFGYFPVLGERQGQRASLLSGGEQQMLAIARALMAKPRLLLLDEPSLGLAPLLVRELFQIIKTISEEQGLTILLVEQDVNLALGIAQHGYLLETGAIAIEDTAEGLRKNAQVRNAYLGY